MQVPWAIFLNDTVESLLYEIDQLLFSPKVFASYGVYPHNQLFELVAQTTISAPLHTLDMEILVADSDSSAITGLYESSASTKRIIEINPLAPSGDDNFFIFNSP